MKLVKHKLCDLVWDTSIYPRSNASEVNVARLLSALQADSELPPIIVEKDSLRIIDGVHRWRALRKKCGDDAVVEVIERVFADDNAAFLASIELNAAHGMLMSPFEITRNAVRAEERGISLELLARAVHMPIEKIERRLTDNTAYNRQLGVKVAIKGSMKALAGRSLEESAVAANRLAGGMRPLYYVNQLESLVRAGLYEWGTDKERTALESLYLAIGRVIEAHNPAEEKAAS